MYHEITELNAFRARQLNEINPTQIALEYTHRSASERAEEARAKPVTNHNAKTNVQPDNFCVGEFVLVRRPQKKERKLSFLWRGPRRIVSVKLNWAFEVEGLLQQWKEVVHSRRLNLYRASLDGKEVDSRLLQYAEHSETTTYQDARALRGIRSGDNSIEIKV